MGNPLSDGPAMVVGLVFEVDSGHEKPAPRRRVEPLPTPTRPVVRVLDAPAVSAVTAWLSSAPKPLRAHPRFDDVHAAVRAYLDDTGATQSDHVPIMDTTPKGGEST